MPEYVLNCRRRRIVKTDLKAIAIISAYAQISPHSAYPEIVFAAPVHGKRGRFHKKQQLIQLHADRGHQMLKIVQPPLDEPRRQRFLAHRFAALRRIDRGVQRRHHLLGKVYILTADHVFAIAQPDNVHAAAHQPGDNINQTAGEGFGGDDNPLLLIDDAGEMLGIAAKNGGEAC